MIYYYIELDSTELAVYECEKEAFAPKGDCSPSDLSDYDLKVFATENEADAYLKRYVSILKSLDNSRICKSRELPGMLYKRRYIVQSLMGEKKQTFRHYLRKWKAGDLVNLHDQSFFLTVRLTKITMVGEEWKYEFELP